MSVSLALPVLGTRIFVGEQLTKVLPHRELALVIDQAKLMTPERATGRFSVREDDPRISGHFGEDKSCMPGVLIQEFGHLTAAALILTEHPGHILLLEVTTAAFREPAIPGDVLVSAVFRNLQRDRTYSFSGRVKNQRHQLVLTQTFSGKLMSQRVFERMLSKRRHSLYDSRSKQLELV